MPCSSIFHFSFGLGILVITSIIIVHHFNQNSLRRDRPRIMVVISPYSSSFIARLRSATLEGIIYRGIAPILLHRKPPDNNQSYTRI